MLKKGNIKQNDLKWIFRDNSNLFFDYKSITESIFSPSKKYWKH